METRRSSTIADSLSDRDLIMIGENLRLRLHDKAGSETIIQNRRYHLRSYPKCFEGTELIDWLVLHEEVLNRQNAIASMQKLLEKNIIHHVCDDHQFKDERLYYRFRVDDETFHTNVEVDVLLEGERLRYLLHAEYGSLFRDYTPHKSQKTFKCFLGSDLVTWFVQQGRAGFRPEAEASCRKLLENGVIRHVTDDHHFKDQKIFYQFRLDALNVKIGDLCDENDASSISHTTKANFHVDGSSIDKNTRPITDEDLLTKPVDKTGSVLKKPITLKELRDPNAPYVKKNIKIIRDNVGFGFVVRGKAPVYVQTVDPNGPGYAAGLKAGQVIVSINNQCVLEWSHTEVADLIVQYPTTINLIIMTAIQDE
ncbi:uncharacterized protein TRIADDRAFT_58260 [Trichoplax adhaerens]|uniref:DEP domain-containing mTOR-interacting protein n=1 Tax=Trichoplax adhaerens TaxID=10228 RepID=B3S1B0_TRIAD|nr:hypothetical protein TRIADDRAFT_58260 [Trichoplax adhaerens]EDV23530.1 hypothetical protein TRIADDRAFT_58260 [Trichoplax adhaerens]|eukprot:XP_002114440.1 hypothetical protein TRIADDRAFT_58260 [Trichoplax adhaerens]